MEALELVAVEEDDEDDDEDVEAAAALDWSIGREKD